MRAQSAVAGRVGKARSIDRKQGRRRRMAAGAADYSVARRSELKWDCIDERCVGVGSRRSRSGRIVITVRGGIICGQPVWPTSTRRVGLRETLPPNRYRRSGGARFRLNIVRISRWQCERGTRGRSLDRLARAEDGSFPVAHRFRLSRHRRERLDTLVRLGHPALQRHGSGSATRRATKLN